MRAYDVALHHPHPPGFPAYIALAKIARLFAASDFRALQAVNLAAGILLFPAVFWLALEAGLRFETSLIGAALCAFIPSVWIFGGTAFSDIPALALSVIAAALFMRGACSGNAYWLGTIVLAIALGIRPQAILVGLYPGIRATLRRRPWEVAVAAAIGGAIVACFYGGAAYVTGVHDFLIATGNHFTGITAKDSFLSADRPLLWQILDRFFIKQYSAPVLSIIVSLLVVAGTVAAIRDRSKPIGRIALTFAPIAVFSWLMLDRFSITRYAVAYMPLFTTVASYGLFRIARRFELVVSAMLIAGFIVWTWPAANIVRTTVSPPVLGVDAASKLRGGKLYVASALIPFVQDVAPGLAYVDVIDERALPLDDSPGQWLLAEIDRTAPRGLVFRRESPQLWRIARHRYFEVALEPMIHRPEFVSGWSPPQIHGVEEWRTMQTTAIMRLPAISDNAKLQLQILVSNPASIDISCNGRPLGRVKGGGAVDRSYELSGVASTIVISSSRSDLRLRNVSWGPAK